MPEYGTRAATLTRLQFIYDSATKPQDVVIIHYECDPFDEPQAAPVRCIAVQTLIGAHSRRFAVQEGTSERACLDQFAAYVRKMSPSTWIHWNMRAAYYGFEAIEDRHRQLGGEPVSIPVDGRLNLAEELRAIYGNDYAPHRQLPNLIRMNSISNRHLLTYNESLAAWGRGDINSFAQSLERKVRAIGEIYMRTINGTLQTNADVKVEVPTSCSVDATTVRKKLGRPQVRSDQDREIYEGWEKARAAGTLLVDYARDHGLTRKECDKIIRKFRARESRASSGA